MKRYTSRLIAIAAVAALTPLAVFAAVGNSETGNNGGGFPVGGQPPTAPPPVVHFVALPPPPVAPPPPVTQNTPPPVFTAPPVLTGIISTVQTRDIFSVELPKKHYPLHKPIALDGIKTIADFNIKPSATDAGEDILVRSDDQSVWQRTSPTAVKLTDGTVLVSIRRPSRYAIIDTPDGVVDMNSDGDVLVSYIGSVLRVDNLSGRGERCKIKVKGTVLDGKSQTVALAAGYELVGSDHKLMRGEVRPADGIARRGFNLLANGHMAVNEFSVESVLRSSSIITAMNIQGNNQEHRVLNDMCKMAAVLNYVNGPDGYVSAGKTGIAVHPGSQTQ